jgi:hypothetical protein
MEASLYFTLTTPADILDHPVRIAMMRAHFERLARLADDAGARFLARIVLGFSDALLVDFLFFNYENDALREAGHDEEAVWEHAWPWWKAAYEREPAAVTPAIEQWIAEGVLVETADGLAIAIGREDAA